MRGRAPGAAAELALVGVALAWGLSFAVIKDALAAVPPHWLIALRFGLAFAAFAAAGPGRLLRAGAPTWRAGIAVGALLYLAFALQTLGLQHTTPARSAFLTGCSVLLVPVLERVLLGRRASPALAVGVGLALVGLALLLHPGSLLELNRGDLLTFACAFAFAGHILALGRYALRVPSRDLAALQILAVAAFATPVAVASEPIALDYPARAWGAVVFLGLVCSAFAFGAQTWAQRRTSPSRTALILALEPVFAAGASVALGMERLGPAEWLGGALVVAGVVLSGRSRLAQLDP